MGVGVVPSDVLPFAEGLDCHLAHGNCVHAQHTVTIQRLILTDRVLQIAVMQRDIFSTLLFVGDRLHVPEARSGPRRAYPPGSSHARP